jgi:BirA family biotin operon repressor/biotin-[acetyl-CoA-carboxylase] ligase
VGDKKIAGILIENNIIGNEFQNCVAGIGVNINQEKFVSDAPNPVSLKNILKTDHDIYECIDRLFLCMAKRYKMLENEHYDAIDDDYIEALYRYNKFAEYNYDGKKIKARISGIGENGMLQLFTFDNKFIECDFKEIKFVI